MTDDKQKKVIDERGYARAGMCTITRVLVRGKDVAGRYALAPLYAPYRQLGKSSGLLINAMAVRRWLAKLYTLEPTNTTRSLSMRLCPPAGMLILGGQGRRTCRIRGLCPWCWVRSRVHLLYNRVAYLGSLLKQSPAVASGEVSLHRWYFCFSRRRFSAEAAWAWLDTHWKPAAIRRCRRTRTVPAAAWSTTLSPGLSCAGESVWLGQCRILAFSPQPDLQVPQFDDTKRVACQHVVLNRPLVDFSTRFARKLVGAFAAYPAGLLFHPDTDAVLEAVNSSDGHSFGRCGLLRNGVGFEQLVSEYADDKEQADDVELARQCEAAKRKLHRGKCLVNS